MCILRRVWLKIYVMIIYMIYVHNLCNNMTGKVIPKTLMGCGQVLFLSALILKILISPPVPSLWYWYLKTNVQPASPGVRHMRAPVSSSLTGSSSMKSTYWIINITSQIINLHVSLQLAQLILSLSKAITNRFDIMYAWTAFAIFLVRSCVMYRTFYAILQLLASLSWTCLNDTLPINNCH